MKYCGVCHSDLHRAANHLAGFGRPTSYPCVPGHELAGVVKAVGTSVTKFSVGDHIGIGCMVDACLNCIKCSGGQEHKCKKRYVSTYQGKNIHGRAAVAPGPWGDKTMGGYCDVMVVHERFGIKIPKDYPLECAGPVMCSGITLFEPLMVHAMGKGNKVAICGLGGLGTMGVKLAKHLGCVVTAISRGTRKLDLARKCGAEGFIDSKSSEAMAKHAGHFDLIIDTIPVAHDVHAFHQMLNRETGKLVMLGVSPTIGAAMFLPPVLNSTVKASVIGGIANTQKVIDLCAQAKIYPDTVIKPVQQLNRIYDELEGSNASGVRYVLDLKASLNEETFGTCTEDPPTLAPMESINYVAIVIEMVRLVWWEACGKYNAVAAGVLLGLAVAAVTILYGLQHYTLGLM